MKKLSALGAVAALSACGFGGCGANNSGWAAYRCADAESSISVKTKAFEGGIDIDMNGRTKHQLRQAVSASGARYENKKDKIEFWSKGGKAILTVSDASMDCIQE